jgi:hypothetical protein
MPNARWVLAEIQRRPEKQTAQFTFVRSTVNAGRLLVSTAYHTAVDIASLAPNADVTVSLEGSTRTEGPDDQPGMWLPEGTSTGDGGQLAISRRWTPDACSVLSAVSIAFWEIACRGLWKQ